jgi:hypothetical protein
LNAAVVAGVAAAAAVLGGALVVGDKRARHATPRDAAIGTGQI